MQSHLEYVSDIRYYVFALQKRSALPSTDSDSECVTEGDDIKWVAVAGGFLAARAMPQGASQMRSWTCTAIVTLTEDRTHSVEKASCDAGISWLHAPIEPISNARKAISEGDRSSFGLAFKALECLRSGERVVVHCQAGCHRTGIFCYVLLRVAGFSPEEALAAIRDTREKTWSELVLVSKKRPHGLIPKAEEIFESLHM